LTASRRVLKNVSMPLRVAIVTDNGSRAESWLRAVNGDGQCTAATFLNGTARTAVPAATPDVVILDAAVPDAFGLCAAWTADGVSHVVMANVDEHDESSLDALDSGARGIVYASAHAEDLVRAVHVVHSDEVWAPRHVIVAAWARVRTEMKQRIAGEAALAQRLSTREREVFRYAASGMGNKELASRLAISEATVKVHLTHIFQKLGVRGRGELAAAFHGILR